MPRDVIIIHYLIISHYSDYSASNSTTKKLHLLKVRSFIFFQFGDLFQTSVPLPAYWGTKITIILLNFDLYDPYLQNINLGTDVFLPSICGDCCIKWQTLTFLLLNQLSIDFYAVFQSLNGTLTNSGFGFTTLRQKWKTTEI